MIGWPVKIFALHGVVDHPRPERFCDRNMVDTGRLRALLERKRKFVPLPAAMKRRGHALTIDDATEAAAQCALLARSLGHEVTLFINPWQIEDGRPYVYSSLDVVLDATREPAIEWNGRNFDLAGLEGKRRFRAEVKRVLRSQVLPQENYEVLTDIERRLGVANPKMPQHVKCLTLDRLRELHHAGVDIQNHYWSHLDPAAHTVAQFTADWSRAQEWLRDRLGIKSEFFACPFGEFFPSHEFLAENEIVCLTLDAAHRAGLLEERIVNRTPLM